MTAGSDRPVAQVGSDPELLAFGEAARRQALMPNRSATEPVFLFSSTDTPILDAFGIYREELAAPAGR